MEAESMRSKKSREIELIWFSTLEVQTSQPFRHYTGHHRDQQKPVKKGILRQLCWISPLLPALRSDAFFFLSSLLYYFYSRFLTGVEPYCWNRIDGIFYDLKWHDKIIYFRICSAKLPSWLLKLFLLYETLTLRYVL